MSSDSGPESKGIEQEATARGMTATQIVLDSKRLSGSAACKSGDFEVGTGFHFRPPFQPVEHEHDLVAAIPRCFLLLEWVG
jgi:hypothetical protein